MKQHIHDAASARLARTHPSSYDRAAALVRQHGWTITQALRAVRHEDLVPSGDAPQRLAGPRLTFRPSWDRKLQSTTPGSDTSEQSEA